MIYNYLRNLKEDIENYINENYTKEEIQEGLDYEKLYEELWVEDSVTGNGSGSYTFNTYEAEEYLLHNNNLLQEALEEFGYSDVNILEKGAEWCDVTIRCYLLSQALSEVLAND